LKDWRFAQNCVVVHWLTAIDVSPGAGYTPLLGVPRSLLPPTSPYGLLHVVEPIRWRLNPGAVYFNGRVVCGDVIVFSGLNSNSQNSLTVLTCFFCQLSHSFADTICRHRSRGSSGSIVSDYGLDDRAIGVRSPAGAEDFSSSLVSRPALGPTQPPIQWVPGVLSPGVKRGRGVMLTTHPHLVPR
jgi:hypothetical protein